MSRNERWQHVKHVVITYLLHRVTELIFLQTFEHFVSFTLNTFQESVLIFTHFIELFVCVRVFLFPLINAANTCWSFFSAGFFLQTYVTKPL